MTKIVVLCDCGCGETVEKQPCKVLQHAHHFKNPSHYYRWMKENKRETSQMVLNRLKEMGEKRKLIHGGDFIEM